MAEMWLGVLLILGIDLVLVGLVCAIVFVATGLIRWEACLPMLAGGIAGGWLGAMLGKRLPAGVVRGWTILVTATTTLVFFHRAYGGLL